MGIADLQQRVDAAKTLLAQHAAEAERADAAAAAAPEDESLASVAADAHAFAEECKSDLEGAERDLSAEAQRAQDEALAAAQAPEAPALPGPSPETPQGHDVIYRVRSDFSAWFRSHLLHFKAGDVVAHDIAADLRPKGAPIGVDLADETGSAAP